MKALLLSLALLAACLSLRVWRKTQKTADDWNPLPYLAWQHGVEDDAARKDAAFYQRVRTSRLADTSFQTEVDVTPDLQIWRRQFTHDEELQKRLTASALTKADLEVDLREHWLDEAWLNHRLTPFLSKLDDSYIRTWYEQNQTRLKTPEVYHASHLFLSRHGTGKRDRDAEAHALYRRLQKGESWNDLTAKHSEDLCTRAQGGDLGWFSAERMPAEFIRTLQKLRQGETSQPVATPLGWHLIRLHARRAPQVPAYELVQQELRAYLETEARTQCLLEFQHSLTNP